MCWKAKSCWLATPKTWIGLLLPPIVSARWEIPGLEVCLCRPPKSRNRRLEHNSNEPRFVSMFNGSIPLSQLDMPLLCVPAVHMLRY